MRLSRSPLLLACISLILLLPTGITLAAKRKKNAPSAPPPPANTAATTLQEDQKAIADDQAALTQANKDLESATAKQTADFENSPDVVAAKKAVADAEAAEQDAHQAVLTKLADDPAYKAAAANEQKLRSQLDDLRNNNASQDAISDKATEVFQAGSITSKLERTAEDADSHYIDAHKKLTDAGAALAALRAKFKDSLKTDPNLASLHQARDDAQKKLAADQAKLAADHRSTAATPPPAKSAGY